MDPPPRLPTVAEALGGASLALGAAAVLLVLFASPAGVAPALVGLVLLGYALVRGIGRLLGT